MTVLNVPESSIFQVQQSSQLQVTQQQVTVTQQQVSVTQPQVTTPEQEPEASVPEMMAGQRPNDNEGEEDDQPQSNIQHVVLNTEDPSGEGTDDASSSGPKVRSLFIYYTGMYSKEILKYYSQLPLKRHLINPFDPKLIMQIVPTIQGENDSVM